MSCEVVRNPPSSPLLHLYFWLHAMAHRCHASSISPYCKCSSLFSCAEAVGPRALTTGEEGGIQEVPVLMEDVEDQVVHMSELNA